MIAVLNTMILFIAWAVTALICLVYADSDRTHGWKQWAWLTGAVGCGVMAAEVWL